MTLAHTHTCSIDPAIVGSTGGRLLLESSGVRPSLDVLHGCETRALEAHFQSREQPKVIRSEIRRVRWLGDDRNAFLGEELQFGGNGVTSGRESGFCVTITYRATHRYLCSNSLPRKAFLSSPNHRTLRISLRVTFGCCLL